MGSRSDVRDGVGDQGAVDLDQLGQSEAAEGALVNETELGSAVVERETDAQMLLVGGRRGLDEHLAAHAQVREHGGLVGQFDPEVLAAALGCHHRLRDQARAEVQGTQVVPADGAWVQHLYRGDDPAGDVGFEAEAYYLDLWEFGHVRLRTCPRRRAWPRSWWPAAWWA